MDKQPATKRKYPKSFYDDGLGDILEFIDDEILVHSETKKLKDRSDASSNIKRPKDKKKLYGDNAICQADLKELKRKPMNIKSSLDYDSGADEVSASGIDKKLGDRVRGLINRLAASTMPFVTSEFEKLYSTNSRIEVNSAIWDNLESAVINKHALTKRKLVGELILLISYLSSKINHDIGASVIHKLMSKFEKLYKLSFSSNDISDIDKRLDNIVLCILNTYVTGLIGPKIVFELTRRLCNAEDFHHKSIELLMIVFKNVGFQLRKDSPIMLKQLFLQLQSNCKGLASTNKLGSRIEFIVEALNAIKNNNMSKIANYGCDIDRDAIEATFKSLIKRTKLSESLNDATYEEISNSSNWYLLETRTDDQDSSIKSKTLNEKPVNGLGQAEEKVCKALKLNKPAEKTIFGALLRASDYVEASNIIIGYGLNNCSDVMLVCIQVAIHEKKYNPFHFNLINNLCKFNRKYKIAAKFAIQDKIRVLDELKSSQVDMFKRLCMELVQSDAIPITILKAIEWANLNESTKEFLVHLFKSISDLPNEAERQKIMSKIEKGSSFAGAMRTFTRCFMKDCQLFNRT